MGADPGWHGSPLAFGETLDGGVGWVDTVQIGGRLYLLGNLLSRTTALKIGYCLALATVGGVAALTAWQMGGKKEVLVVLALLLLVPGRIQGAYFRYLLDGRRLLAEGEAKYSLLATQRFLDQIREQPWQKRLLWLSWSVYTTNVEAMALSNIGAAHLELGAWDAAERSLGDALEIDPAYPLPYFNLSVIAELRGERHLAEDFLARAAFLGYTGSTIDRVIASGQELLARIEGRGMPPPGA